LLSAVEFSVSENKGKLLENMVALELIKSGKDIFYFKNNYECDFIIRDKNVFSCIQVAYELKNNDTKERELRGLNEACQFLGIKKGTIITFDEYEEIKYNEIDITICPVYKYFLKA